MRRALLGCLVAATAWAAEPWPGEPDTEAVDLTDLAPGTAAGFGNQLSDLFWNPTTRTLWVSRAPGGVWALRETQDGGFAIAAQYAGINSDYEGITQASLSESNLYLLDETAGFIRQYSVDSGGGSSLLRAWNLSGVVPPQVGNAGPEGLAFVPDGWLLDAGFPASAKGAGGLFIVAHQNGGQLYLVDLNPNDGNELTQVAVLQTSHPESSALAFDRSSGRLYVSHNTGGNFLEVGQLSTQPNGSHVFLTLADFKSPNTSNLEGFAVTPQYGPSGSPPTEAWCFWADDDGNTVGRPGLTWYRHLPSRLTASHQDSQTSGGTVAVTTQLTDAFSNDYQNQQIEFAVTRGGGSVSQPVFSSPQGLASTVWTLGLGSSETQELVARAPGFSPLPQVSFTATLEGETGGPHVKPCGCDSSPSLTWGLCGLLAAVLRRRRISAPCGGE